MPIINNFNPNKKTDLAEFYNKKLHYTAEYIANAVIKLINTNNISYDSELSFNIYDDNKNIIQSDCYNVFVTTTNNTNLDWLENLDILIANPERMNTNDFMFVMDTAIYKAALLKNIQYGEKVNFQRFPIKYYINVDNQQEMLYIQDTQNQVIKKASLLFIIPNPEELTTKYLQHIILHEIQHIHDVFIKRLESLEQLNKDFIAGDSVSGTIYKKDIRDQQIINKFYNNYNINDTINRLTPNILMCAYLDMAYILNVSEMWSRLYNIKYEIEEIDQQKLSSAHLNMTSNIHGFLCNHSNEYLDYSMIFKAYSSLIKLYPIERKKQFAEEYIKKYIASKTPKYGLIYDTDFNSDGKYDEKSFDNFFKYHINNIEQIIFEQSEIILKEIRTEIPYMNENFIPKNYIDRHTSLFKKLPYKSRILKYFDNKKKML